MSSIFGRAVILPMTNKSGGALAKGDVVILDSTNDEAVTTTTTSAYTGIIGVVVEENGIANNAVGRVQFSGYCALVTPNASVTRGHYGATFTVAKQATDFGASRGAGAFCVFLKSGTTPSAVLFGLTDGSGVGLSDPMTTRGDIIVRNASNVTARLATGAAGTVLKGGTDPGYALPAGYEFDYVAITTPVSVTHTTEGTADVCITGTSVAYDGATTVLVEVFSPQILPDVVAAGRNLIILLYDGATILGRLAVVISQVASVSARWPFYAAVRLTPSNASHQYIVKATVSAGTGTFDAGVGGTAASVAAFLRVTKV